MRIAVVIHSLGAGGAERSSLALCEKWSESGHDVVILTLGEPSTDAYLFPTGVRRLSLHVAAASTSILSAIRANLSRIRSLGRAIRLIDADVVVGMMTTTAVLVILATASTRAQAVAAERLFPPAVPAARVWHVLRKVLYRFADAVVVQTETARQWVETSCVGSAVTVIPNLVTWPLARTSPVLDPLVSVPSGTQLVLAAGRLDAQKGFDMLVDAFAAVVHERSNWKLVILGDGPERGRLLERIERHGLAGRILLPGRAGNMSDWYERADLFVMSSRFEGFPNVLLEAMSYGMAVISVDCPSGPGEIVTHGNDGLLVPPESGVPGLSSAMASMMDDPVLRARLGENALGVRKRFAPEEVAGQWVSLFRRICGPAAGLAGRSAT